MHEVNSKKQISYPNFVPRLFSTTIDLFVLVLISMPVSSLVSEYIFSITFRDFLYQNNISYNVSINELSIMLQTPELRGLTSSDSFINSWVFYIALKNILQIFIIAVYFIGFWIYKGTTPGKIFMHMKLIHCETMQRPTKAQCILRFLGYFTFPFGIWFILFTKNKQALHDKISKTVVIKS